jgi:hypothetical protein
MWLLSTVVVLYVILVLVGIFFPLAHAQVHLRPDTRPTVLLLDSDQDQPISDRMLIGTHGSAAYRLDVDTLVHDRGFRIKQYGYLVPGFTRRWGINQRYSLYDQLLIGVRFLHLEISLHNGEWCTIHSFKAGTLRDDLLEIRRFVSMSGSTNFTLLYPELFDNDPEDTDDCGQTYLAAIADILGTYQRVYRPHDRMATYYNKVAIVEAVSVVSSYTRTTNKKVFLYDRISKTPSDRFLHWVMTPNTTTIVCSMFLPFIVPNSLSTLYATKHEHLTAYLRSLPPLRGQCLIVDHVDPEFVAIVDAHNHD